MRPELTNLLKGTGKALRDILPIASIIAAFQVFVIGEPMADLGRKLFGLGFMVFGLTLLLRGITIVLLPAGRNLAADLARKGSLALLLSFAFALGFGSTVAEPALFAVATEAGRVASFEGIVGADAAAQSAFASALRFSVAASVGLGVAFGVLRIVLGWPVTPIILGGYGVASLLALISASPLSALALDAGTAATSVLNIPLIMALGIGLASTIRGRAPLVDGFGLVAIASLMPMLVIMASELVL
ncbi:DUF1538 family protein [Parvibaculum sp.]|uniref:DUF1538 family protein n=1 Tax=Parvibaculum sp. TaxID=2024848 RepID=UPI00391CF814